MSTRGGRERGGEGDAVVATTVAVPRWVAGLSPSADVGIFRRTALTYDIRLCHTHMGVRMYLAFVPYYVASAVTVCIVARIFEVATVCPSPPRRRRDYSSFIGTDAFARRRLAIGDANRRFEDRRKE